MVGVAAELACDLACVCRGGSLKLGLLVLLALPYITRKPTSVSKAFVRSCGATDDGFLLVSGNHLNAVIR